MNFIRSIPVSPFSRSLSRGLSRLSTPDYCIADFCIIPVGTGSPSASQTVAEIQKFLEQSGLKHYMHATGTTIEGSWDDVLKVVGQTHTFLHDKGVMKLHTDIRVGSRIDKKQLIKDKVESVELILAQDRN